MIPIEPDWRTITNALYDRYGSYKRLLDAMAKQGALPDYSTLSHLRSGQAKRPSWPTGAALLNLYAQTPASRTSGSSDGAARASSRT
jgi:hypothetical protein